jgi:hypothetical protein
MAALAARVSKHECIFLQESDRIYQIANEREHFQCSSCRAGHLLYDAWERAKKAQNSDEQS